MSRHIELSLNLYEDLKSEKIYYDSMYLDAQRYV